MSIETTFKKVDKDIADGDLGKARDRLHGLLSTYPEKLEVRNKLGGIYWDLQYPSMAGRFWYLETPASPEMYKAREAFEKSCGDSPVRMLNSIKFQGDFNAIKNTTAEATSLGLAERASKEENCAYSFTGGNTPFPYTNTWGDRLTAVGCIAAAITTLVFIVIGIFTTIQWLINR